MNTKKVSNTSYEGKSLLNSKHYAFTLTNQLSAGVSLISAVVADQCYSCMKNAAYTPCEDNYKQSSISCNFEKAFCVTVQDADKTGNITTYRGCEEFDNFQDGCISTINQGTKCAAACRGDKCNGDVNLPGQISTGPSCNTCINSNGKYVDCASDWSPESSATESCTFGDHCFTTQRTFGDVITYQRGCQTNPLYMDYEEGCVDTKQGEICYKGCNDKNCNVHVDLTANAASWTMSLTSLLLAVYCLQ